MMARATISLIFSLVVVLSSFPCSSSTPVTPRDVGGADADKSHIERTLSGISEAFRYIGKAFGEEGKQRTPKTVELALVGFGRTGTTSIVSALQLIGYTFMHDDSLGEVADLYAQLAPKENPLPMDAFVEECGKRGFDAIFFFSDDFLEWAAKTDHVKVLLTTRDTAKKWAESWLTIAPMVDYFESRPFIWSPTVRNLLPGYFQLIYKHISTQGQPEKYKDLATLERAYEAHLVKVRRMIPPDRLLEFNVKEGWEPLCNFLDKPIPDTKFPHVNDRTVVLGIVWTFWLVTWIWPIGPLLVLYLVWMLVRMFLQKSASVNRSTATGKKQN